MTVLHSAPATAPFQLTSSLTHISSTLLQLKTSVTTKDASFIFRGVLIQLEKQDPYVTKDELRAELERQAQRFTNVYGGEITTYAAEREPERKPWRKKPTVLDQVFQRELQKLEQEKHADCESAATGQA